MITYKVNGTHRNTRLQLQALVFDLAFYGKVHVRPGARGPSYIDFELTSTQEDFEGGIDFLQYDLRIEVMTNE